MAANTLLAGTVMDASAALLNDVSKQTYTYVAQIPYLNMALRELQEFLELNNIPVTDAQSVLIAVVAGVFTIPYGLNDPHLPDDMIEPINVWESTVGLGSYTPLNRVDSISFGGTPISSFGVYSWTDQLNFPEANIDIDIKLDYVRNLFAPVTSANSSINVVNGESFLEYRNAGLCAQFIGENKSRADELNGFASLAIDRAVGIGTKGKQSMVTRRRPFRSGYKNRHSA